MQEARGVLIQGSRRSKRLKTRRNLSRLTQHEAQAAEEVAAEDVLEAQAADEFAEDQAKFTYHKASGWPTLRFDGRTTARNMGSPVTSLRLGRMMGASISSAHKQERNFGPPWRPTLPALRKDTVKGTTACASSQTSP
jgi:hypothetical protein